MSDPVFTFPGGETVQPPEDDIFSADVFAGLGSMDVDEDPFAGMEPMAPFAGEAAASTTLVESGSTSKETLSTTTGAAEVPSDQPDAPVEPSSTGTEPPAPDQAADKPPADSACQDPSQTPRAAKAGEEANPLLAAMDLQESANARKAAEPIYAQLPLFSYNGNREPIEDLEQTFEQLRLSKLEDFPEFEEAQNLSWIVAYGSIEKKVADPSKEQIGNFKRSIEASKEFLADLKKSKDKRPKCIVKPTVRMQKKGTASGYKAAFLHVAEARASDKTISFIPARDGRVYERRVNDAGEFLTPASDVTLLDEVKAGFTPSLPRIPYQLLEQALSLFRYLMNAPGTSRPLEALVHIYWDRQEKRYFLHVPEQTVGKESVEAVLEDEDLLDETRYLHYADLHSHNDMPARFSRMDNRDERANRVYLVAGRLDRYFPELRARICNGGHFCAIPPERVLEPMPTAQFPVQWLERIHTRLDCEAAA